MKKEENISINTGCGTIFYDYLEPMVEVQIKVNGHVKHRSRGFVKEDEDPTHLLPSKESLRSHIIAETKIAET